MVRACVKIPGDPTHGDEAWASFSVWKEQVPKEGNLCQPFREFTGCLALS
jgi:hypothetical protein